MTGNTTPSAGGTAARDDIDKMDRVFLEKLRLAATVIFDLGEDDGIIPDTLQTEISLLIDRVDRALLLPASEALASRSL